MTHGAVNLCLIGALLVSGSAIRLGQFVAIDAEEFLGGHQSTLAHAFAHDGTKGVIANFPELGTPDSEGVCAQGCSHAGEEGDTIDGGGMNDELYLVFEGVDGIDDVVVVLEMELVFGVSGIGAMQSGNLCFRVYLEQSLAHNLYFGFAYSSGGGHHLTIDVGGTDAVGIDDGEMANA